MRRIQLYLSLMGSVCALTGALLLFGVSFPLLTQLQPDKQLPEPAIYVGTDTCFTCHVEQQVQWSNPLNPRVIDDQIVNPHVIPINMSTADALLVGSDHETLMVRGFDTSLGILMPTIYHFADQYPSSLGLSDEAEEQLR